MTAGAPTAAAPTGASSRPAGRAAPRPFLKWAGGKRQALPHLRPFYPARFHAYVEPFVGSGAVFFDLYGRGLLAGHRVVLLDSNADLVGCYLAVRDRAAAVVRALARLAAAYERDPAGHYYHVRDRRFNPARRRLFAGERHGPADYPAALAAMLIYLNRTGFNGLFRLNASGAFNVPMGRYVRPRICDAFNLRRVAAALQDVRAHIAQADFTSVLTLARPGDFLYFDPPYAPVSRTARFTSYTADRFSSHDQRRLQQVMVALARRGCHVLLSNSTAAEIRALYEESAEARSAGLRAYRIPARRAINSNARRRGEILEYVITNLPRRA